MERFKMFLLAVLGILCVLGISVIIGFFMAWVVMLLWNCLAPAFNLPELTYWQSFALYMLCTILFKSVSSSKSDD